MVALSTPCGLDIFGTAIVSTAVGPIVARQIDPP
jgi:hypothetical protein